MFTNIDLIGLMIAILILLIIGSRQWERINKLEFEVKRLKRRIRNDNNI
jgi:hypothetical protein